MRVVHLSKVKGIAGSERHLLTLLPGLAGRGVDVSMWVLAEPDGSAGSFCEAMQARGVPVRTFAIRGHLDLSLPGRLSAALRNARPDIVHTHLVHADLYGLPAAYRAGVPHAISSRHNDNPFRRRAGLKLLNRRAMRRASRVIAISGALAGFVRDVEGIEAGKIVTIRYGLEPPTLDLAAARQAARAAWGVDDSVPVVGFFGRLIEQKGVDTLLEAWLQVSRQYPAARLVIVGDGKERPVLEARAAALGLNGVRFAGWAADAACLMPGCDIIAMPSRWEGFGLVALEAMAAARPLVASRVSALPEIVVDLETGLLVPPGDAAALAEAIAGLLADPAWAQAMGQAGRARLVEAFSPGRMIDETLAVYEDVMRGA